MFYSKGLPAYVKDHVLILNKTNWNKVNHWSAWKSSKDKDSCKKVDAYGISRYIYNPITNKSYTYLFLLACELKIVFANLPKVIQSLMKEQ